MTKIALIPIDDRPVCYQLSRQLVDIADGYELSLPERHLLGNLTKEADIETLFKWLETVNECDYIVLSMDTLAYGGLINSRRVPDSFEVIMKRLNRLKEILKQKQAKIFAFSSIMRISNNNVNEEEKEYWNLWGKAIFDWSYNLHQSQQNNDNESLRKQNCIATKIPQSILDDYVATRERNFKINLVYLDWLKENIFDFVVFSKDDCAKYGLNVIEAAKLTEKIKEENLNATVKTGADEIPLTLIARVFSEQQQLKVYPKFTQPEGINKISKYEDLSVKDSVFSQIQLSGGLIAENEEKADLILLVNNFANEQGELVMNVYEKEFDKDFELSQKPTAIADILNANGSDNKFVDALFKKDFSNLVAYAGWNTTGNTLGSVLCFAYATLLGKKQNSGSFKKALFTRFCDDWAYQANVRAEIKKENNFEPDEKMQPFVDVINKKIGTNYKVSYSFPWNRFFEIEVNIKNK